MECLKGCDSGRKNHCTRDPKCLRVKDMAAFIEEVCQEGQTTTIPEIAKAGGLKNPDQWRDRFRDAVAGVLGVDFFIELGRVNGESARAVRRIAIRPRDP